MNKKYDRPENRNKLDASHGKDEIEIEKNEAKRMSDMDTFLPKDGDLGDEEVDYEALPDETKKHHNYYDSTLSSGGTDHENEIEEQVENSGIHIAEAGEAGIAFNKDNYVDEDDKLDVDEKRNNENGKSPE